MTGPELVPGLLELLQTTLDDPSGHRSDTEDPCRERHVRRRAQPPPTGGAVTSLRGPSGRSKALIITGAVLVAGFLLLTGLSSFWTERLWFNSVNYGSVFTTMLVTPVVLFVVFGLLMALVVGVNMWLAYRYRPTFRPASPEQTSLDRYREAVNPMRRWLLLGIALLMGAFAGTSAAGQWRAYLLWRNGGEFGTDDPYFTATSGSFVFETCPSTTTPPTSSWPPRSSVLMAAAVVQLPVRRIRLQAASDRLSGAAQVQLSVLVGCSCWPRPSTTGSTRYDLLTDSSGLITA